jgi:hypothetical protein
LAALADRLDHFKAVHLRHHHIQNDRMPFTADGFFNPIHAIVGGFHCVA